MIYARDHNAVCDDFLILLAVQTMKVSKKTARLVRDKVAEVEACLPQIDAKLTKHLEHYSLEEISRIEKNVLRLGLYALFYETDLPPEVAIAEAIRVCCKFGSVEGAKFVNAVLDGVYKELEKHAS